MSPEEWTRTRLALDELFPLEREAREAKLAAMRMEDPAFADLVAELIRADDGPSVLDASLTDLAQTALHDDFVGTLVQTQIGPYRLVRVLGEGGMGVVYLAERLHLGGHVAIKLLRDAWLSPMRRERFHLEQHTLARLNHPNIAQIHDAGVMQGDTPWFVMEYVEGVPLTEWVREHDADLPQRLALVRQVAEAIACTHGYALVHRDLKPSNILVTPAGEVKLLDFGIAKDLAEVNAASHTVDGLRPLTPAYAAPEQLKGEPVGLFTDIYGLGLLLYELLTGELPRIDADGFASRPSRVVHGRNSGNLSLTRAQWKDLDAICDCALQPEPGRRYSSAEAFLQDVSAFEQGRVLSARPPSALYTLGKFARRNRLVLSIAAAAVLLLAVTAVIAAVRVTRSRDLALRQLSRMARLQRFTSDLFTGGTPDEGRSAQVTTDMLLRRGELEADGLHEDPELQSAMYATLGGVWQHLGDLPHAEALLQRALEERDPGKHRLPPDADSRALFSESLTDMGLLRLDQRRMDEAEILLRRAVSLTPAHGPVPPDSARAMNALGDALATHGKYPEAQAVLERAVRAQEQAGRTDTREFGDSLSKLADTFFHIADFKHAEEVATRALTIYRRTVGDSHPAVARAMNNLGNSAQNQGHYAAAEADLSQSLTIDERWYGPDHTLVAEDLQGIAKPYEDTGREDLAQAALLRALAIQEHHHGHVHSSVALILNDLAVLADGQNRLAEAEANFREALSIWRATYGDRHPFVGKAYANLASVAMERKDYPEAEELARRGLAVYRQGLPAEHPDVACLHIKLGRILLREGKLAEAEPETRMGFDLLRTHDTSEASYLKAARKDLAAIYTAEHKGALLAALNQP